MKFSEFVAAGIVHKTAHWKGFNSLRMPYGKDYVAGATAWTQSS